MKIGKVVLGISVLLCVMLYWTIPKEDSIDYYPPQVEVTATLTLMQPYAEENARFRDLNISCDSFNVAETEEDVKFIDEEELDRRLTNAGQENPFAQTITPLMIRQSDSRRFESYSRVINIEKITEEELAERIDDYVLSYRLKGTSGETVKGRVAIGEILQIQYPLDMKVYAEVSTVDESGFAYAKEIFDIEGLEQKDVLQLDIGLICEEVKIDDTLCVDLGPIEEQLPNLTRLQYYINNDREREKRKDEIYHTEALLCIQGWGQEEIETFLNQYQLSYEVWRWDPDFTWSSKVNLEGIWRYMNRKGDEPITNEF